MNNFITENTEFSDFYQFPKFLLTLPISYSAKIVYMLLYERCRISKDFGRIDKTGIFVNASIHKLAKEMGKSVSTVKTALNELEDNELITRRSGGFHKANIYHLLTPNSQLSNPVRKQTHKRSGNKPLNSQFSDDTVASFPTTNKIIEQNIINKKESEQNVTHARKYGRYENFFLTPDQHDAFVHDYPKDAERLIQEMSTYCASEGKAYKSYDAALRSWAEREIKQKKADGTYDEYHYTYEPLDANAVMPWDLV